MFEHHFDGKVAVVTGAGRGLGRAIALALAGAGAGVTVAGRTRSDLEAVATEVKTAGARALVCPTDVTDEAAVEHMIKATVQTFGRIDILVNNSGVLTTTPLLDQSADDWDRILDTNLRGTFLATKAAGKHFVAQRSGKVLNVASSFALKGTPHHAAYCASKAAVMAFTTSMAVEWARYNVQVNAVAPGYFVTDINAEVRASDEVTAKVLKTIPARRMGDPRELAPWVLTLVGPGSDYTTGSVVVIDGGQSIQ
ncbi:MULTISPECIES: SDR family NAD(P)-dependent oxidoreductase [unclassified Streptomyces]|uniref:SDR family NAD(P)-dependent oxidoreductase n=1 Tax=unclassified Streptomyces TaxID=2593676 RepID=UPI00403CB8B5